MYIFDNIIFSLQNAGGISVMWSELLAQILSKGEIFKCYEYSGATANLFRHDLQLNNKIIKQKRFNRVISQFLNVKVDIDSPFIFHSSYFRTCNNPNAINVTTVHDFIYEQERMNPKQRLRTWMNYRAIMNSDAIVCVSNNTRQDLFRILPGINPSKVSVIHNGASLDYYSLDKPPYLEYSDYILFVGGRQSYKNFDFAIAAAKASGHKLLICGAPLRVDEIFRLNQSLKDRYKIIVYPSNKELNKIFNSVFCLLYPSSYEGFGIPIIEAQKAGCPVIALGSSSIPEVLGEEGLLMNVLSIEEVLCRINSLKSNQTRRNIIMAGFNNSKKYSWEKMATEYISLYQSLLQK